MKEEKEMIEESIQLPQDMAVDVLAIIVKEKLLHTIIQVIENRSLIVLAISYDKNFKRHQQALNNIRNLLEEYDNFRFGEQEKVNWR